MKGYTFVFGVDGFGYDVAPAYDQGVYLDYNKAYARLIELNTAQLFTHDYAVYEEGYGVDYFPDDNLIMAKAEKEEDWDTYSEELDKHMTSDPKAVCDYILETFAGEPPIGFYSIVEIEIHE